MPFPSPLITPPVTTIYFMGKFPRQFFNRIFEPEG